MFCRPVGWLERWQTRVDFHLVRAFEKVHRPQQHLEKLGLQVDDQVLLALPFPQKAEFVFIFQAAAKVAAVTALDIPDRTDKGGDRLGQFLALIRSDRHTDGDQDHEQDQSNLPAKGENRIMDVE